MIVIKIKMHLIRCIFGHTCKELILFPDRAFSVFPSCSKMTNANPIFSTSKLSFKFLVC